MESSTRVGTRAGSPGWRDQWRLLRHRFSRRVIHRLARGVDFDFANVGPRYLLLDSIEHRHSMISEQVRIRFHLLNVPPTLPIAADDLWRHVIERGSVTLGSEHAPPGPVFFYTLSSWTSLEHNFQNLARFTADRVSRLVPGAPVPPTVSA